MSPEPPAQPPTQAASARAFVLGLLVLLVLVEGLLSASAPPRTGAAPHDAAEVRALLHELAREHDAQPGADPDQRWLLLGDSVLVGDTGAAELPNWAEHRLIDALRAELSPEQGARFEQVALDGMIPADMLALVEALEREDPEAEVSLLIELSPRHFSPSYAEVEDLSRPWLDALGRPKNPLVGLVERARTLAPLYRHRSRFRGLRERLSPPPREPDASESGPGDERGARVAALARLSVHYRESVLDPASIQVQALVEIVERCRASGRRIALFTTPLEDRFAASLRSEAEWGAFLAALDRLIEPDGREVALLPMDHPLFASELFWDHVHLRPEGHRLLALNLLAQLGLRLEHAPPRAELIRQPGFDASLIARIAPGSSEGAAWQARLDHPSGLALAPGRARLVVADTNNHVLRELHGDMSVVSTLAGREGEGGHLDGPLTEARLRWPRSPVFVGQRLYFCDGGGRHLRRIEGQTLTTLAEPEQGWRIQRVRAGSSPDELLTLEVRRDETRLVIRSLEGEVQRVAVVGQPGVVGQLSAFTPGPEGVLFVATADGSIHRLPPPSSSSSAPPMIGPGQPGVERVFANSPGAAVLPQAKGKYPRPFAEVRLSEIVDMVYVEAYGGLLVQDYAPHPNKGHNGNPVTERAHLRLLDLERGLVYPWLKPLAVGFGYAYANQDTQGFASYFHEGSMVLDPETRALYYLETARSRLLRLEDGVLGLAKLSAVSGKPRLGYTNLIGESTGAKALAHYHPSLPTEPGLAGPYEVLIVGSSMTTMSEAVGEFSLGRLLIERLDYELQLRDRTRIHGFLRAFAGGRLDRQIKRIRQFHADGGRPDLIIIDANGSTFIREEQDEAEQDRLLTKLIDAARAWDSKLVLIDTSPFIVRNREPLHPGPERVRKFLAKAEARGLTVIRVADRMLDASLRVGPFATPPVSGPHPPTWAIEAIADALGTALLPTVREALRDRKPAHERARPRNKSRAKPLAQVFTDVAHEWDEVLEPLPEAALQYINEGSDLTLFVDLAALPAARTEDLDALVLACIYERSVRFSDGARVVEITLGRFAAYDEYGAGVREGATIVAHQRLGYRSLRKRAEAFVEGR